MGSISSAPITKKINFEDVQQSLQQGNVVLINTLEPHLQQCLIQGTVSVEEEVKRLNALLAEEPDGRIIIYGIVEAARPRGRLDWRKTGCPGTSVQLQCPAWCGSLLPPAPIWPTDLLARGAKSLQDCKRAAR